MARNVNKGNYFVDGRFDADVIGVPVWLAGEKYQIGDIARDGLDVYLRINNGTSTATFATDQANWTQIGGGTTGAVVDVTPTPIPGTVGALEGSVPAAGLPTTQTSVSVVGVAGAYQKAQVINGAWALVDRPANEVDVTPAAIPADIVALEAAVPAAGEATPNQWVAVYGAPGNYRWAAVIAGVWTPTSVTGLMVGATPTTSGLTGTVPVPTAGQHDLILHGDGLWREIFPTWAPNVVYSAGATALTPTGGLIRRIAAGLSGATYDSNEALGWQAIGGATSTPRERVHLTNTAVNPAVVGQPTLAEITAAMGVNRDTILYYTGTNVATDNPTHVYHVDASGDVTLLRSGLVDDQLQDRSGDMVTATVSGTAALDLNQGAGFDLTLGANLTAVNWTWLTTPQFPMFQSVTVRLRQDATGGRTVDFSQFGSLIAGTPSLDATANANPAALFNVMTFDGGATRYVLPILTTAAVEDIQRGTTLPDPALSTLDGFIVESSADPLVRDGFYYRTATSWVRSV